MLNGLRIAFYGAVGAGVIAAAYGLTQLQNSVHPALLGADYLQRSGYSDIEGGDRSYFSGCGKQTARQYIVTNPRTGQRETATVCFGLFGPHRPLFGR